MNPQFQSDQIEDIINSLSANERYFKVYYKDGATTMKEAQNQKPHILVYENDDEKPIQQLMEYFTNEIKKPEIKATLMWELYAGFRLKPQLKIKDIKKELRNDNINGLMVFAKVGDQSWADECAIKSLVESEDAYYGGALQIPFYLSEVDYIFYLPITAKTQLQEVKRMLSTQIKRVFAITIQPQNINIILNSKKEQKDAAIGDIKKSSGKSTGEKLVLKFLNKVTLKAPPHQNNTFIVIKGNDIDSKMFHYDDLKDKKVVDVLASLKEKPNWNEFGLLISEIVIRPGQTFEKIKDLVKNTNKHTKHLTANIITEGQMFEIEQNKIRQQGVVNFETEKIIVTDVKNLKHRKDCQQKIRVRAQKTGYQEFKNNLKNVQPILLYTSELCVQASKGSAGSIYRTMNTFLREQEFGKINQKDYKRWEYRFSSELWFQFKKIPPVAVKQLWRGVNYVPKHHIGQLVLFKQFNSSSTSRIQAQNFAYKALYKITNAKSCRPIKEFSYYQSQDEVLFEPYVTLKINKISTTKNSRKNIDITFIETEQVEKPKPPESKSLFILWVDDKTGEGKQMWEQLVQIQKTTVMIQLLSTEQLQKWLSENKKGVLDDPTVEMVMITNMTRVEKGVKNDKAGVYAINTFKKYKPNNNIFVYIGWVEGTLAKLKQHNYEVNDKLRVSKSAAQIKKFLSQIGVK